jgi:hypothetical protein
VQKEKKEDYYFQRKEEKYRHFVFKPSNHKKIAVKLDPVKSFSLLVFV